MGTLGLDGAAWVVSRSHSDLGIEALASGEDSCSGPNVSSNIYSRDYLGSRFDVYADPTLWRNSSRMMMKALGRI